MEISLSCSVRMPRIEECCDDSQCIGWDGEEERDDF